MLVLIIAAAACGVGSVVTGWWSTYAKEALHSDSIQRRAASELRKLGYDGTPEVRANWKGDNRWGIGSYHPSPRERALPPPADHGTALYAAIERVSKSLPSYYWTQRNRIRLFVGLGILTAVIGALAAIFP